MFRFSAFLVIFGLGLTTTYAKLELPPEVQKEVDILHSTCVSRIGITDDDVEKYEITNNDPKMMCYMKCLMREAGWLHEDGTIPHEDIMKDIHIELKEIISDLLVQCYNVPGK
nr:odorant-binding protein [Lasioderma serricorne]